MNRLTEPERRRMIRLLKDESNHAFNEEVMEKFLGNLSLIHI